MAERKTGLPVDPTSPLISQILSPLVPMSYQVDQPYSVNTQEVDGGVIYSETPMKVSDPQFAVPPVITGGIEFFKQLIDEPTETASGIATAIGEELAEYPQRQIRTALAGGETYNPETGEVERYDPLSVPATTALGSAASIARVADDGSTVLGIMAGRNSTTGAARENMAKELRKMGKSDDEIFRATQAYFDRDVLGRDTSAFRHEIPNSEKSTLKVGNAGSDVSGFGKDFLYAKDRASFGFKPDVMRYEYDPASEDLFLNDMPEGAKLKSGQQDYGRAPRLEEVLDYPELFEEYPQLKDVYVVGLESPSLRVGGDTKTLGGFYLHEGLRGKPTIAMSPSRDAREFQSDLLHEVQHAVQSIENTPGGGEFMSIYNDLKGRLGIEGDSDYVMERALNLYEALYGEAEARVVQRRFMNPELKKEVPVKSLREETPANDVVVDERDAVDMGEQAILDELEYGDVSYEDVYPEAFSGGNGIQASLKSTGLLGGDKPQRFYHGTTKGFKEFDPDAPYTFVSDNPETAGYFSEKVADGFPNIRPVYLKESNFFDIDNPDHIRQLEESDFYQKNKDRLNESAEAFDYLGGGGDFLSAVEEGNFELIEGTGLVNWIRSKGFGGFTTKEPGLPGADNKNYAVFNVEDIVPGVAKKKEGGVVSLLDMAQNMTRRPRGLDSLIPIARNMNRSMVS